MSMLAVRNVTQILASNIGNETSLDHGFTTCMFIKTKEEKICRLATKAYEFLPQLAKTLFYFGGETEAIHHRL